MKRIKQAALIFLAVTAFGGVAAAGYRGAVDAAKKFQTESDRWLAMPPVLHPWTS